MDDPLPVPAAKKRKITASKVGGSSASGVINNSAMPIEVFGNCDDDGEEEEEQNVVDEVLVQRSGVKDTDSPRHVTIQTKTTPTQSMKWTESAVTSDTSEFSDAAYAHRPRVNWPPTEVSKDHDEFDYYNLMVPSSQYDIILRLTNIGLRYDKQRLLTKDEFIHIIGIRLAIALESNRGGLPTYFSAEYSEGMDTVLTGGDFDRKFGTSMSRFQSVMQH